MGKINKFANVYYKTGQTRKVSRGKYGRYELNNVSMGELENMIDEYPEDGDRLPLDHMKMALFAMYKEYGNPHEEELIERIKAEAAKKTSAEEVKQALKNVAADMDERTKTNFGDVEQVESAGYNEFIDTVHADGQGVDRPDTIMDEYVDFEEIKEAA